MKYFTAREMVRDLIDSGLTQQQIAERIRVSQATIARVFKGSDTRYEAGKRLAGLHREVCADRYPPDTPKAIPGEATATTP
ncbi:MAG: helix-turn-helix domain-containing protein [Pseudomonadota bacterium]